MFSGTIAPIMAEKTSTKTAPKKAVAKNAPAKKVAKKTISDAFAVIETGGKQYIVSAGDIVEVELLGDMEEGATVEWAGHHWKEWNDDEEAWFYRRSSNVDSWAGDTEELFVLEFSSPKKLLETNKEKN